MIIPFVFVLNEEYEVNLFVSAKGQVGVGDGKPKNWWREGQTSVRKFNA